VIKAPAEAVIEVLDQSCKKAAAFPPPRDGAFRVANAPGLEIEVRPWLSTSIDKWNPDGMHSVERCGGVLKG
jgi:hypothetical protein